MNTRPTPETDEFYRLCPLPYTHNCQEHARKLERERDEAHERNIEAIIAFSKIRKLLDRANFQFVIQDADNQDGNMELISAIANGLSQIRCDQDGIAARRELDRTPTAETP